MKDCIVVGAGISGLGIAARLKKEKKSVLVLEKSNRAGGVIETILENGFLVDFGPSSVLHSNAHIDELAGIAGIEEEMCFASETSKKRFVVKRGKMVPLPGGPLSFLATPLFSPWAKLRLLGDLLISRGPAEESIAQFTERRLGKEFLDYAVGPFVSGIYAGDPKRLSVEWAFPKIFALEKRYGSLLKGAIKTAGAGKKPSRLFGFDAGMERFPRALAKKLGKNILFQQKVTGIKKMREGYAVTFRGSAGEGIENCQSLVLALPASALDKLLGRVDPGSEGLLSDIPYAPVAQVFLGFGREQVQHPLDGFGVLIPRMENKRVLGVIMNSSIFPGRVPPNHVALTCFLGGMMHPEVSDWDDQKLLEISLKEISPLLGIRGGPVFTRVRKWKRAIPQYQVGYQNYLAAMAAAESRCPGLFIGGNIRGGISVADCIKSGAEIAEKVTGFLDN